ncbi:hypothetical protein AGABI2DRAFT_67080 [Agaricus bisporus var. bisporus H97]|uniref:hypothetical protein n=1 Tax=Agaricus bisporus var. bisporus (strain H97 / ATCC MYA-4626 / FGSC 10389) TaxID=936046 RepID=UPI00029F5CF1|nr:hypothetical protein AGABI2DRAFT_67080 [Agaricus bisporus var. bisporus H97]EKV48497.1 hypothetical protein AGABI2DRAFT_67080 [Agaricus bisporus var. bisporus H97]
MSQNHNFLFASLDSKLPHTSRRVHIRRLYDILQLCIQRNDVVRASRAWAILVQCKEFRWDEHWATGLYILNGGGVSSENIPQRINYLPISLHFLQEEMLKELILLYIMSNRYQDALDELELYLPSFPYQDNPILHIYAGLLSLQLAQKRDAHTLGQSLLRDAQAHLNQAKTVDPSNTVAEAFLHRVNNIHSGHDTQFHRFSKNRSKRCKDNQMI